MRAKPPAFQLRPRKGYVGLSAKFGTAHHGLGLSVGAMALHVNAIALHANRPGRVEPAESRTVVPRDYEIFAGDDGFDVPAAAAELVAVGWWEVHPDGWRILGQIK